MESETVLVPGSSETALGAGPWALVKPPSPSPERQVLRPLPRFIQSSFSPEPAFTGEISTLRFLGEEFDIRCGVIRPGREHKAGFLKDKNTGFRWKQACFITSLWLITNYLTSLNLSFLICKIEVVIPTWQNYWKGFNGTIGFKWSPWHICICRHSISVYHINFMTSFCPPLKHTESKILVWKVTESWPQINKPNLNKR